MAVAQRSPRPAGSSVLNPDVAGKRVDAAFDDYRFLHSALPELDLGEVSTATSVLGKALDAPVLISCLTDGTPEAARINANLAQAAGELGLPMGVDSGRIVVEDPSAERSLQVRSYAPDALLFANLGAVQLVKGIGVDDCRGLVDRLDADALVLHLNPLQEALQPEGDTEFSGVLSRIGEVCERLGRPVIVKEVGWGLAPDVVRLLFDAGVSGVDVAGAGGGSWSGVERLRLVDAGRERVAAAFSGWGIPTAAALEGARRVAPDGLVFASGGIRDGIDVAKAIALGADLVGLARPFLHAAEESADCAVAVGRELIATLRLAMFCVGAGSLTELRGTPRLIHNDAPGARVHSETLSYSTRAAGQFLDITDDVRAIVARSGVREGHVHLFSNHTTAALRINENEPRLLEDFRGFLAGLAPAGGYLHDDMSKRVGVPPDEPVNGHAHCSHLLLSSSESIPLAHGDLQLGTWQSVFLIELCSARTRTVTVQLIG